MFPLCKSEGLHGRNSIPRYLTSSACGISVSLSVTARHVPTFVEGGRYMSWLSLAVDSGRLVKYSKQLLDFRKSRVATLYPKVPSSQAVKICFEVSCI